MNLSQRIHPVFFYLLLFFLPTQLGKHFWPSWSFVHGIRVDYLSPTIYLTDIVLGCLLLGWGLANLKDIKNQISKIKNFRHKMAIWVLLVFAGLNVILAKNSAVALYRFWKFFELALLGFYVATTVKIQNVARTTFFLSLGLVYESFLAWGQFLTQSSLTRVFNQAGISPTLWFLGERSFDISTLSIAQAALDGRLVLRPYGTFPHPNVLAGFIVVVLTLALGQILNRGQRLLTTYYLLFTTLGLATLFITFSRSGWLVGASSLTVLLLYLLKILKTKRFLVIGLLLLALFSFFLFPVVWQRVASIKTTDIQTISRRIELSRVALRMIKACPLIGVGLGNFIPRLSDFSQNRETIYWLQPVHNIFLLTLAETGLIGLGLFLWFLVATFRRLLKQPETINFPLLTALASILALGLFDHYFLTLQQTQMLFALVLGLSWIKTSG